MMAPRLGGFALLVCGLAVLLALAGFAGAMLCSLPGLPGDGLWNLRRQALEALGLVLGAAPSCMSGSDAGIALSRLASSMPWVVLASLACILLWETAGRRLRLALWRARGGHAILLGQAGRLEGLARLSRLKGAVCFLAPDAAEARTLAKAHPLAEVHVVPDKPKLPDVLARLGAPRARLIAAASEQDYLNLDVIDAVLRLPGLTTPALLLRLEDAETRAEFAGRYRALALARGMNFTTPSLSRNQLRAGCAAAEPGRFMRQDQPQHIAIIGSGPLIQPLAFHLARQGYGLEDAVPVLSVIRTGREDFTSGALERLSAASAAVSLRPAFADGANGPMLDRAIAAVAGGGLLSAVHCAEADPPRALARAERVETMLLRMGRSVPPLVAYCSGPAQGGESGMIRCVAEGDLADAQAEAQRRDSHARALHEAYLREQRLERGEAFGSAPAEVEWAALPDHLKDDNRAFADHMDYKLARAGFKLEDGGGTGDTFRPDEIEFLARIEHARWMAAKLVEGWRLGAARDNDLMLHPSLVPYQDLPESEKEKDRAVIRELQQRIAGSGLVLRRQGMPS